MLTYTQLSALSVSKAAIPLSAQTQSFQSYGALADDADRSLVREVQAPRAAKVPIGAVSAYIGGQVTIDRLTDLLRHLKPDELVGRLLSDCRTVDTMTVRSYSLCKSLSCNSISVEAKLVTSR